MTPQIIGKLVQLKRRPVLVIQSRLLTSTCEEAMTM